jgi:hypothetical protein
MKKLFTCLCRVKQKNDTIHEPFWWIWLGISKEGFYLKYYSPLKAYCDRSHIYNLRPHPGENVTEAWGRLKGFLLKNPNHGFSKGIILVNFYVRMGKCYKEFLDNSS